MSRRTQIVLTAVVLFALAAGAGFWMVPGIPTPADNSPSQARAAPPSAIPEPPVPMDPQALAEVREAYEKALGDSAPPRMLELMHGPNNGHQIVRPGGFASGEGSDPLPMSDPFVTPARFNPSPATDLPPLPPELASRPELLPPPAESSAAGKKEKEGPADDLPPLPPVKKP
jgi:hypothetical protein